MSANYRLEVNAEKMFEIPMVDLAYELLKAANVPFYYRDLMSEIAKLRRFTDEQVMENIAQLYTEINIDGRFACVGNNVWGLKRWYPIEKANEQVSGKTKRPRIINDEDEDEDLYVDDEHGVTEEAKYELFHDTQEKEFAEGTQVENSDPETHIEEENDGDEATSSKSTKQTDDKK